jgi:hypothetical protein
MKRTLILVSLIFILLATVFILFFFITTNDRPVADNNTVIAEEDTPVAIVLSGSDSNGDSLSFNIVSGPSHGSLRGTEPNLVYTPNKNFNGSDGFTFRAGDGSANSEPAAVTITVKSVNDPPEASDDNPSMIEDTPVVVVDVLANDTDIDNDRLIILGVTQGQNGSVTINANNMLIYKPNRNFSGTDSFNYTVSDGKGGTDTAEVNLTITPINDPPVITSKPPTTTRVWSSYSYDVDAKDPDANDILRYILVDKPDGMIIDPNTGMIEWRPDNIQDGDHGVTVKVEDANNVPASDTQSFTVTVTSLSSPLITPMTVEDVYDHTSRTKLPTEDRIAVIKAGDNKYHEIEVGSSISVDFSDPEIPKGGTIISITIFVEHFEDRQFPTGKLRWIIGKNLMENPVIWASINAPTHDGPQNKATDSWDITSIVGTPEMIDSLQFQIENDSNMAQRKVCVDYIYGIVRWY